MPHYVTLRRCVVVFQEQTKCLFAIRGWIALCIFEGLKKSNGQWWGGLQKV